MKGYRVGALLEILRELSCGAFWLMLAIAVFAARMDGDARQAGPFALMAGLAYLVMKWTEGTPKRSGMDMVQDEEEMALCWE
ncbi:MAG: hypothetical protein IJW45_03025 [Oscillospiraceae bacterium]|nr:hypothetical protein [Oscillospiraceae bacterium]